MQTLPKRTRSLSSAADERTMLKALATAHREELRRLGVDLHNSIVQSLAALTANLDVVRSGGNTLDVRTHAVLEQSSSIARECFQQLLTLSEILCPQLAEDIGLPVTPAPAPTPARANRETH